ncbi:MAG: pilus assembly PilX N-terminal domain-containing protein [Gemmatimonadales bacterium]
MRSVENERGIALALAIMALVVIGALVAGAFFVGMQEQQVGRNTIGLQQASAAAEEGAQLTLADWDRDVYNWMPLGSSTSIGGTLAGNAGWYRGNVVRIDSLMYMIESEGFNRDSTTRQRVGLMVRLRPVQINVQAALETQGGIKLGGSSFINGNDNEPSGWPCDTLWDGLPGIRMPDSSLIQTSGCSHLSCVDGSAKVEEDTTVSTESLTTFGDLMFDDLRSLANKFIPAGTHKIQPSFMADASCATADPYNWGEPLNPAGTCGNHFPVVWADGSVNINGVRGQGVLIVNGDLDVQGGFEFYGPVIVRGAVNTQGTGGHFNGGVIAANVNLDQSVVLGDAVVTFSSCALARALRQSAPGSLLQERSWVNLY